MRKEKVFTPPAGRSGNVSALPVSRTGGIYELSARKARSSSDISITEIQGRLRMAVYKNMWTYSLMIILMLSCCGTEPRQGGSLSQPLKPLIFTAEPAPEWTALMERTSGWFGADGIFSIPLDGSEERQAEGKKTLFIFSDTYIGEVKDGVPQPGNVMVNNSIALMRGTMPDRDSVQFEFNRDPNGNPVSYFVPDNENSMEGEYFWLGDGFVNRAKRNALYIFAYHVHKTGPNVFDFEATNVALLKIRDPAPEKINNYEQFATPLGFVHPEHGRVYFGSGIMVNTIDAGAPFPDGYVYIYGIAEGRKSLVAARTRPSKIERINAWRFWNGEEWVKGVENIAPITDGLSNELSVTPTDDGRYLLTFTVMGISDKIGIRVGDGPAGPFGEIHEVYTCPEYAEKGVLPYNAKAHYHLSAPDELLVSYNTITFDFWEDIQKDATIYHPRFIRVRYGQDQDFQNETRTTGQKIRKR